MKKEIKGFENYTVNDCGDNERTIYNEIRCKYKKPQQYKNGYFFVSLFQNGKNKIFLLHRLVAEAFIPNPDNLPVVNHIDGDKTNPKVNNLEWCSYSENTQHAHRTGLQTKTSNKEVIRGDGKVYPTLTEAALDNNISKSAISKVIKGERKTAGGWTWQGGHEDDT